MRRFIHKLWRFIAARPSFRIINELIFDCSIYGLGIANSQSDKVSGEAYFINKLLPCYVKDPSPAVFDIGANVGNYTHLVKNHFPSARIWAFEPNPRTYEILKQNLGSQQDVILINKGLGASEAVLELYDIQDKKGSTELASLYRDVIEDLHGEASVAWEVSVVSLDTFVQENGIGQIHLLKIDTEGYELEVLKGAANVLSSGAVDLLQIEFNEMNLVSRVFFRDFIRALPDYIPYRLLPKGVLRLYDIPLRTELFAYQNIVFVHKKFNPDKHMIPQINLAAGGSSH